jgi:hypothetical protein
VPGQRLFRQCHCSVVYWDEAGSPRANGLNQYASRLVPTNYLVTGELTEPSSAKVVVNGQVAPRKNGYYWRQVDLDNQSGPDTTETRVDTVIASGLTNQADITRLVARTNLWPARVQAFTWDNDGNLSTDGLWQYTWDAEDRLVQMESLATVPAEGKKRLTFAYGHQGRRVRKTVETWNGSGYGNPAEC